MRQLLEWNVRLSPVAKYPLVRVFEISDDGKIRRLRVYFDKLGIEQRVAAQYPAPWDGFSRN